MKPETPKCQTCGTVTSPGASYCVQCGQAIIEWPSRGVGRLIRRKSIRAAPFLLAIFFFFLPWSTTFDFGFGFRPTNVVEVTGVELVAGIDQVDSEGDEWKRYPEPIPIIVLAIAFAGAVISIGGGSRRPFLGIVLSLVGILLLWLFLFVFFSLTAWVENYPLFRDKEIGLGYYLLSGAFLVGALINAGLVQALARRPVVISILLAALIHGSFMGMFRLSGGY